MDTPDIKDWLLEAIGAESRRRGKLLGKTDLEKMSEVSRQTITGILNARQVPSEDTVRKLADALNASMPGAPKRVRDRDISPGALVREAIAVLRIAEQGIREAESPTVPPATPDEVLAEGNAVREALPPTVADEPERLHDTG